jgi:hypothetical protein
MFRFRIARRGLSEQERTRSFLWSTRSGMTCAVGGWDKKITLLRCYNDTLYYAYNGGCYYILACVNELVRSISESPARRLGAGNIHIM